MNRISEANRRIALWRFQAKQNYGYTDAQLARKIGCSRSVLTHKDDYYTMPFYQAMELERLAQEGEING